MSIERDPEKNLKYFAKKHIYKPIRKSFRRVNNQFQFLLEGDLFKTYPFIKTIDLGEVIYQMEVSDQMELEVLKTRAKEHAYIKAIMHSLPNGGVYIDIGAAIGTHIIPPAIYSPGIKAYAFEPDNEIGLALLRNAQLNNLDNISLFNFALWNQDTFLRLQTGGRSGNAPRLEAVGMPRNKTHSNTVVVEAYRLDTMVNEGLIPHPDVVKIDAEGAEGQILEGMGNLRPQHIFAELHPNFGVNIYSIFEMMSSRGYTLVNAPKSREKQMLCHFSFNGS